MNKKKTGKVSFDMRITLIAFALIPTIISVITVGIVLNNNNSKELKTTIRDSMESIVEKSGEAFDYSVEYSCEVMEAYSKAPVIQKYLRNPQDEALAASAEEYTAAFYATLEGWEGIYLADWNSQVLAHPAPTVVGRVMREGERLKELQDAMLGAEGVYNVGIITSPASGQLIESLYYPIYDDNNQPLGYVGAGTYVDSVVSKFSDVATLEMSSAYIYFVDATGIILFHPNEEKMGTPAENAAVKELVAQIAAGEHPTTDCVEYDYNGSRKYAAYYVGDNENYIAILTADESEAMASINENIVTTIVVCLVLIAIFVVIALIAARTVSKPLSKIADVTDVLSTGDVTVNCDAKSGIRETASIIRSFGNLKEALNSSMTNVKDSASALSTAIVSVDQMTNSNVDSISQINVAIDEVASTSQAVAENAQVMAEKATELGDDIGVLNANVSSLFDQSVTIKNVNEEATDCMKSVYRGAKESVEAVQSIADKISETNTAITGIENAVRAIESIASQTNLLSLNASIEAARAGEAGAGFAIVAAEIRSLADSSANSAKEIKSIIENVVALSGATVEISNKVYEIIRREENDIENAQNKFDVLSECVESSISEIDTIKKMAARLDEIKVDFTNATSDLGAISEELGASAQEVAASCQTVTLACTDTQASTEEMRAINENMKSAIEFFKL